MNGEKILRHWRNSLWYKGIIALSGFAVIILNELEF